MKKGHFIFIQKKAALEDASVWKRNTCPGIPFLLVV